jgi:hypothetical protein
MEWDAFFESASASGIFSGGSEMGKREILGNGDPVGQSDHIVGYMRFDSENKQEVLELLKIHPVILSGGTVELCELPKSQKPDQ